MAVEQQAQRARLGRGAAAQQIEVRRVLGRSAVAVLLHFKGPSSWNPASGVQGSPSVSAIMTTDFGAGCTRVLQNCQDRPVLFPPRLSRLPTTLLAPTLRDP